MVEMIDMSLSCQRREDLLLLRSTKSSRKRGQIHSFFGLDLHPEGQGEEGFSSLVACLLASQ